MIVDGLSWQQFSSLPHISRLPLSEQAREYDIYNQTLIQEVLAQQYYNQQVVVPNNAGGGIDEVVEEGDLPSGCIEFVNNTTDGIDCRFWINTSAPTNYTITWGDGQTETGEVDGVNQLELNHDYADSDTEYTVRLCFDDISVVTQLEFNGDD